MPYKHTEMKIPEKHDRRTKLTEAQREEIRTKYGKISQRKLALEYGVSRRLIQFIGNPESYEKNKLARELRGGSKQYYDKDAWRVAMKEHRHYKQQLMLDGKLETSEEP